MMDPKELREYFEEQMKVHRLYHHRDAADYCGAIECEIARATLALLGEARWRDSRIEAPPGHEDGRQIVMNQVGGRTYWFALPPLPPAPKEET
jgi:hypothetical protein